MTEEGDEDAQRIKGTPKGPQIKFKSLKQALTEWRMKNEERRKNDKEHSQNWSWKHHESVMEAPRPWFSSSFSFFSLILSEICLPRVLNPFPSAFHALFIAKIGEEVAAQLA